MPPARATAPGRSGLSPTRLSAKSAAGHSSSAVLAGMGSPRAGVASAESPGASPGEPPGEAEPEGEPPGEGEGEGEDTGAAALCLPPQKPPVHGMGSGPIGSGSSGESGRPATPTGARRPARFGSFVSFGSGSVAEGLGGCREAS